MNRVCLFLVHKLPASCQNVAECVPRVQLSRQPVYINTIVQCTPCCFPFPHVVQYDRLHIFDQHCCWSALCVFARLEFCRMDYLSVKDGR